MTKYQSDKAKEMLGQSKSTRELIFVTPPGNTCLPINLNQIPLHVNLRSEFPTPEVGEGRRQPQHFSEAPLLYLL